MGVVVSVACVLQQKTVMPMVYAATPASQTVKTNSVVPMVVVENAAFATRVKIVRPQANVSTPTHANPIALTPYVVLMDAAAHAARAHQNWSVKTVNA